MLVDSHLTRAQQPIDVALGHALQLTEQEIIQPLARIFLAGIQHMDHAMGLGGTGFHS
jgi:hypothetical protein